MSRLSRLLSLALLFAAGLAHAETESYVSDPEHTFVYWGVNHFGTSTVRGRFDRSSGTITLDREAKTGSVDFEIDVGSVSTGMELFDKNLRSDKFFDAGNYPKARFVGSDLKFSGDKLVEVAGELTLRDKTNPMKLVAKQFNCYNSPLAKKQVCGGDFEASFSRGQYGITFGWPFVSDTVRLQIQIEAFKQ
jgi:polyisoprenoid-binding protein YceI